MIANVIYLNCSISQLVSARTLYFVGTAKKIKFSEEEQTFLADQRDNRKMMIIRGVDAKITSRNIKKYLRKNASKSCDVCREFPETTDVLKLDILNDNDSDQFEDQISKYPSFEAGKVFFLYPNTML